MKDTTTLNKSKDIIKILIKYDIPVFFVETHCKDEKIRLENTNFYKDIKNFIYNNFNENKEKLLLYKENTKIYNFIRINQKKDDEDKSTFGINILIGKILYFFLYEKINELINNNLRVEQNFIQQKNILLSCLSDLTSNCRNFSLHDVLFRNF